MRPIRTYLLAVVLGATIPPALLTSILVGRAFTAGRAATERRLLDSARIDALALDRQFQTVIGTLQALATSATLDSGDLPAFHEEASRVKATQRDWYSIVLLTPDGRQQVNTRLAWGTALADAVDPDSLTQVLATGAPAVGGIRPPQGDVTEPLFAVRVPVMRNGSLKYVLTAVLRVAALDPVLPAAATSDEVWTRTILDPAGTIAARTRGPDDYVGNRAAAEFLDRLKRAPEDVSLETTREGVPVYAATGRGEFGWSTVVVVPRTSLDGPVRASLIGLAVGGVLLTLGGFAAAFFASRRLSADLDAAADAAAALVEGRTGGDRRAHTRETLRLQQSIATAARLLERRAAERDEQLLRADAARADAEEASRTKDQFLAILGHELRNPLAPAFTALELMKARDPEVFRREREVLERQMTHMTRLVNDLLDVSRLSRGKVALSRAHVELRAVVDRAMDMAGPLINHQRHMLEVQVPLAGLPLDADVDRLVQVVTNLLTNAANYTPPGGHICVSASAADGRAILVVEDNGPGIPDDLAASLFQPFVQGPRAIDRRQGGLGLGLALARLLVELHGGTIRFESRSDGPGSRFVVSLPLMTAEGETHAAPVDQAAALPPKRVLIVDDNVDAAEMLGAALSDAGHTVALAYDAATALQLVESFAPEVGVFDIGLPDISGYELARRAHAMSPLLRLIAVTGYGQQADIDKATAAGFEAHCVKPVSIDALAELVARHA